MEKEYKIPLYGNKGYVIMKGECSHIALIRARRAFPNTSFNNHRIKTLKTK